MNNLQKLINRQLGNHVENTYDTAIKRLHCHPENDYKSFESEHQDGPPVFACKFAPETSGYDHLLALANEDGKICIQNTKTGLTFTSNAHRNAIFDLEWMPGNMKLVSVSGDHTARLFSVNPTGLTKERIFHGHFRSVKTVACRRDDPAVFATGSRDGAIYVWDSRAHPSYNYIQKPDRVIAHPHSVNDTPTRWRKNRIHHVPGTESVTGLAFQDDVSLVSCGAGDGHIKIWDLRYFSQRRNPVPKNIIPMSNKGFSNLIVDKSGVKLYASCMDHTIYCYNISTQEPVSLGKYMGHQQTSFYVKSALSPDGQYLISGSGDNNGYIWNVRNFEPIVRLEGHLHEVTCVAWGRNIEIVTCSDDLHHKLWKINTNPQNDSQSSSVIPPSSNARKRKGETLTPSSSMKKQTLVCENCQMRTPGSITNCENCSFGRSTPQKHRPNSQVRSRLFPLQDSNNEQLATVLEEPRILEEALEELPNFVVSGEAPHLRNYSPQKKKDKDWLTKIRIEQSLRCHMDELTNGPTSPKCAKSSPKYGHSGGKKSAKKSTELTGKSPLLKYFCPAQNITPPPATRQK